MAGLIRLDWDSFALRPALTLVAAELVELLATPLHGVDHSLRLMIVGKNQSQSRSSLQAPLLGGNCESAHRGKPRIPEWRCGQCSRSLGLRTTTVSCDIRLLLVVVEAAALAPGLGGEDAGGVLQTVDLGVA